MSRSDRRRAGERGPLPVRRTLMVSRMDVLTNYGAIMPLLQAFRAAALYNPGAQELFETIPETIPEGRDV